MAPVILQTEVHCLGCARKIRKAISRACMVWRTCGHRRTPGWWSSLGGPTRQNFRDGSNARSGGPSPSSATARMVHLGPQHYTAPPPLPAAYPPYQRRYVSASAMTRQYVPPGEPSVCFEDEQPGGCCVQ